MCIRNNNRLSQAKGRFLAGKVSGIFSHVQVRLDQCLVHGIEDKVDLLWRERVQYVLGEFRIVQVMTLNGKSLYCLVRNGEVRTCKSSLHLTKMHLANVHQGMSPVECWPTMLFVAQSKLKGFQSHLNSYSKYVSGDVVHWLSTK